MPLTDEQLASFVAGERIYQEPEAGFAVEDVFDWAGSTVVDIGKTMWNSLTPDDWNTETDDILTWLGATDAARFYQENRDLVEASSFFGGLLIPFGPASLAARAVGLMKSGKLAAIRGNPFAAFDRRLQSNLAQTKDLIAADQKATAAYKALRRERALLVGGEAVLDSFATEALFATLINEHAWLKDYSPTEFVVGGLAGAGLVGTVRWIGDSKALKRFGSDAELGQVQDVFHLQSIDYPTWQEPGEVLKQSRAKLDQLQTQLDTASTGGQGFRLNWLQTQVDNENKRFLEHLEGMMSPALRPAAVKAPAEGPLFKIGERSGTIEESSFGELVNLLKSDPAANALDSVQRISSFGPRTALADDYVVTAFDSIRRKEVTARSAGFADTEVQLSADKAEQMTELLYGPQKAKVQKLPGVSDARSAYEAALRDKPGTPKLDVQVNPQTFRLELLVDDAADLKNPDVEKYARSLLSGAKQGATIVARRKFDEANRLWSQKVQRTEAPREVDIIRGAKRPGDELPVKAENPSVVFDPWMKGIISSVDAAITLRASDAGHRVKTEFDFSKTYDPLRDDLATWEADGVILDAVNTSRLKPFSEAQEPLVIGGGDVPHFAAAAAAKRFTNMTVDGKAIDDIDSFLDAAKKHKSLVASRLAEKGYAPEQIAIYTATPLQTVNTLVAERFSAQALADADLDALFTYTRNDREFLGQVLAKSKMKLQGETVRSQLERQLQPAKQVDAMAVDAAEDSFIFEAVANPATPQALRDVYDQNFTGDSLAALKESIVQALSTFKAGNRFFTSADQALRAFGEGGIVATSIGTNTNRAAQRLAGQMASQIAPLGRAIQMDTTGKSQAQFQAFMQAYRSLSGAQLRGSRYDPTTGRVRLRDGNDMVHPGTGQVISIAADSPVGQWVSAIQDVYNPVSRAVRDTNRRLVGETKATDAGLYIPYVPMDERLVAYIFNSKDATKTRVIAARSPEQLATLVELARKEALPHETVALSGAKGDSERDAFEAAHGYVRSGGRLERASSLEKKSGIGVFAPTPTAEEVNDIVDAISGEMHNAVRTFTHRSLGRVFRDLDEISTYHQRFEKAGNQGVVKKVGFETQEPATVMKRTLLNLSAQQSNSGWSQVNNGFDVMLDWALNGLNRAIQGNRIRTPLKNQDDFDDFVNQMRSEGIPIAWSSFDDYLRSSVPVYQNMSKQFVNTMSGLMTTVNLKALEFAHAAVTTLSTPILLSAELTASRATTESVTYPLQYMSQGVRTALSDAPEAVRLRERMRARGYAEAHISEIADATAQLTKSEGLIGGALNKADAFNRHKVVEGLSFATNWAERWTRELAFYTGYHQARAAYPEATEELLDHMAQAFVKRSMGNYTPRQRPAMFQGTLGQSLGLYQTFMLTFGQMAFRHLERGDRRALGLIAGMQGAMFGLESLPGYDFVNTQLQDHVLKDDMSLRSTAFRLFGSTDVAGVNLAEAILFGMPSAIFDTALTDRASLDVRLPVALGGGGELSIVPPIASGFVQTTQAMANMGQQLGATFKAGGGAWDYATAFSQAVSMQSMWRPGARMAEIFQNFTVDRNGRVLDDDTRDNGLFNLGNLARVSGARPLQEHALRQARYTNRYLDARDRENRRSTTQALRRWATDPASSSMSVPAMFRSYMDQGGSAQGWQQALNLAHRDASVPETTRLRQELNRHTALQDIVDSYVY